MATLLWRRLGAPAPAHVAFSVAGKGTKPDGPEYDAWCVGLGSTQYVGRRCAGDGAQDVCLSPTMGLFDGVHSKAIWEQAIPSATTTIARPSANCHVASRRSCHQLPVHVRLALISSSRKAGA